MKIYASFLWVFVLAFSLSTGCSKKAGGLGGEDDSLVCAGACSNNDQCAAGSICAGGECRKLCTGPSDCSSCTEMVCLGGGTCGPAELGDQPQITAVLGNNPVDGGRIVDGLVVQGYRLSGATFTMSDINETVLALDVRSQNDTSAELILPVDVVSGEYVLTATNAAGPAQVSVQLLLPELDGDTLLARINDASGQVSYGILPVGTTAGTVAAGNHSHPAPRLSNGGNYLTNTDFSRSGGAAPDAWTIEVAGASPDYQLVDVSTELSSGALAVENGAATRLELTSDARVVVDSQAAYEVVGTFRKLSTAGVDGTISLGVRFFDPDGAELLNGGDWWVYAIADADPGATWVRYAMTFGAGTTQPIPDGAHTMTVSALLNDNSGTFGTQIYQVQGLGLFDWRGWIRQANDDLTYNKGNVGIGTNTPSPNRALDVVGDARIDGKCMDSGIFGDGTQLSVNTNNQFTIPFNKVFSAPPVVVAMPKCDGFCTGFQEDGFQLVDVRTDAVDLGWIDNSGASGIYYIHWIAMGACD